MSQNALKCSVVFMLLKSLSDVSGANYKNHLLGYIPWSSIANNDTILNMKNNSLLEVGSVPAGKSIEKLQLQHNKIRDFPDLVNLSLTLKELYIGQNPLRSVHPIQYLTQLVHLVKFALKGTLVPLLPEPRYFPPSLGFVVLTDTVIRTLPNMCLVNNSLRADGALRVEVEAINFTCDRRMLWTKLAYDAGVLRVDIDGRTLAYPVCLEGSIPWTQLTIGDFFEAPDSLVCEIKEDHFRRLSEHELLQCVPSLYQTHAVRSVLECSQKCQLRPGCLLFAVDGVQCVLTAYTDNQFGVQATLLQYDNWYIMV